MFLYESVHYAIAHKVANHKIKNRHFTRNSSQHKDFVKKWAAGVKKGHETLSKKLTGKKVDQFHKSLKKKLGQN